MISYINQWNINGYHNGMKKNEMIVDILSDYDSMMDISGFQMGY